jgi:hypothetical protein
MGTTPVVVSEVFSAALAELGPAAMARRVFEATRAVLRRPDQKRVRLTGST